MVLKKYSDTDVSLLFIVNLLYIYINIIVNITQRNEIIVFTRCKNKIFLFKKNMDFLFKCCTRLIE